MPELPKRKSAVQAFAWSEIVATLQDLKEGKPASIPQYDFVTSSRKAQSTSVESADVILFDGILAFYNAGELCSSVLVATSANASRRFQCNYGGHMMG
jgi:uridine kinase